MDKKEIFKIIAIIISIIAVFAIIEIMVKKIYNVTDEFVSERKHQKEYAQIVDYRKSEREMVDSTITEFVECVTIGEYQKAYDMLDENYKDYTCKDLEKFKLNINEYIKANTIAEVINYNKENNIICALVKLQTDNITKSLYLKILQKEKEVYKILMPDIDMIKRCDYTLKTTYFEGNTLYSVDKNNKRIYVLELKNITSSDITINKEKTYISYTNSRGAYNDLETSSIEENLTLPAQTTKRFEFVYDIEGVDIYSGEKMTLSIKTSNGNYKYIIKIVGDEDDGLIAT